MLHTFELEAEEYKVDMLNDKPVVRNEISMTYLFPALQARPVVKSIEYKTVVHETVEYETVVYKELLDESMVEIVAYEDAVYDEMSVFPTSEVLLLYPSCPDVAQDELPTVENLLPDVALDELPAMKNLYPDVALDELPAVEDLSASVDTTGNAMPYYLVRPVIRQRYQLISQPRQNYQVRIS